MPISEKVLRPRLAEVGRIKIGGLGEKRRSAQGKDWQLPVKYDHFVITRMEKGQDGNFSRDEDIHRLVGDKPTELKVILLTNRHDLNFRCELAHYQGARCLCRGDGEKAERVANLQTGELTTVECPCPNLNATDEKSSKCKPHGVLSCVLADSNISGGVWRFATTSWNTIRNLDSSLKFLGICTGGKIAGVPLILRYYKKQATKPDGSPTTIGIVGLFYPGNTVALLDNAISNEKKRIGANLQLETLEDQMRKETLSRPGPVIDEDEAPEFHPIEDEAPEAIPEGTVSPLAAAIAAKIPQEEPETITPEPVADPKPAADPTPTAPAPTTTAPTAPAAVTREALVADLLKLRATKCVSSALFTALAAKTIGRPTTDATKWTDDELGRMVQALRDHQPNGGAK